KNSLMKIPQQYLPVIPYLIMEDSMGFSDFAKEVFDAVEQLIVPAENQQILHGELRIGDAVIMFAAASEQWKEKTAAMYIYVENVDETYQKALAKGAKSLEQPNKKEYGYTAGIEDPFGNYWFIVEGEK